MRIAENSQVWWNVEFKNASHGRLEQDVETIEDTADGERLGEDVSERESRDRATRSKAIVSKAILPDSNLEKSRRSLIVVSMVLLVV